MGNLLSKISKIGLALKSLFIKKEKKFPSSSYSSLKSYLENLSSLPPKSIYYQGKSFGKEIFFNPDDKDNQLIEKILKGEKLNDLKESRAMAIFLYSALGDALGAHTEFDDYKRLGLKEITGN